MRTITDTRVLRSIFGGFAAGEGGRPSGEYIGAGVAVGAGVGGALALGNTATFAGISGGAAALGGTAGITAGGALAGGFVASYLVGYQIGTAAYENSTMVQDGSGWVVGGIMDGGKAVGSLIYDGWNELFDGDPLEKHDSSDAAN